MAWRLQDYLAGLAMTEKQRVLAAIATTADGARHYGQRWWR